MADGIKLEIKNLDVLKMQLLKLLPTLQAKTDKLLDKHAHAMATKAEQLAPKNLGTLGQHIRVINSTADFNHLARTITVNTPYAAFMEFGTGKFAAEYVASLPADWQTFAAQFRGQKTEGTFYDFVIIIKQWIKEKGIDVFNHEQEFDPESGYVIQKKQRHTKDEKAAALDQAAYLIARKIIRDGVRAQPYLYPAYKEASKNLINELPTVLR